jgi:hypothetical protein
MTDIHEAAKRVLTSDERSRRRLELREELRHAINYTSTESESDTPDFILAEFLIACLDAFAGATNARAILAQPAPATDDPEFDGTDFAHPAWWRGHEQTTAMVCQKVNEILDGKDDGKGENSEGPWRDLRKRLLKMVQPAPAVGTDHAALVGEEKA